MSKYRKAHSKNRTTKPAGAVFTNPDQKVIKTIEKLSLNRGRRSEEVVKKALNLMTKRQDIIGFWKSQKREDRKGIDYFVRIFAGERGTDIIYLQIKTGKIGAKSHQEKAKAVAVFGTDSYAHIIIVPPGAKPEEVIPGIQKIIKRHQKEY